MSHCKIYQVYYRPEHRHYLDQAYEPYNNEKGRSPFFENEVIKMLVNSYCHTDADYFGVFSWRFSIKIRKDGKPVHSGLLFQMMKDHPGYDVYSFFGKHPPHNPFDPAVNGHGHQLLRIAQLLCEAMNLDVDMRSWKAQNLVYMNFFVARHQVYERYVSDFLVPIMARLSDPTEQELNRLIWSNSLYLEKNLGKAERRRLLGMYGKPYYPFHAFVCERLFSLWLSINSQYSIKQLI